MVITRQAVDRTLRASFVPPPKLSVSEWADAHRFVSRQASAFPGRWRTSLTPYLRELMDCASDPRVQEVVFMKAAQVGAALELKTPIPTRDGWTTMGDVQVGDVLFDEAGRPCRVVFATDPMENRPCFEVAFSDGSTIVADADHRWYVESDLPLRVLDDSYHGAPRAGVLTTSQIIPRVKYRGFRNRFAIPVAGALELEDRELPIPPYVLGVWLGDGNTQSGQVTVYKTDLAIARYIEKAGVSVVVRDNDETHPDNRNLWLEPFERDRRYCIRGHDMEEVGRCDRGRCRECHRQHAMRTQYGHPLDPVINAPSSMTTRLRLAGLLGEKHIPPVYLRASRRQRLELVQGLMDTDGHVTKAGRCEFANTNRAVIEGFEELLSSLGLKFTTSVRPARANRQACYRVSFLAYDDLPVFKLGRKLARQVSSKGARRPSETRRRRIVSVTPVESRPVRCIQVDSPSHLYLAGRTMIPTHNTEALNNILGYFIDQDPSPILVVQISVGEAEKWSKEKLAPMVAETPRLASKIGDPRSRDSDNTILAKAFPGGHLGVVGANAPSGLRARPRRVLLFDEVDGYPESAGTEGDPISLAEKRAITFRSRRFVWKSSTPTIKSFSRIEDAFEESDQRYYEVPCPECGAMQALVWAQLKWESGKPETAAYECEACEELIPESRKREMLALGEWVPREPGRIVRGYHLNALYSPFESWAYFVAEWKRAQGDPEKLQVFVNTVLGETWEEAGERVSPDALYARREPLPEDAEVPMGVGLLTAGVDVQGDRLELQVRGWGRAEESWLVHWEQFWGDPGRDQVWEELDAALLRHYRHESGSILQILACCVDSGGHHTEHVYRFTGPRVARRVWAIKGMGEFGRPLVTPRASKKNKGKVPLHLVGTFTAKDLIFSRLKIQKAGPGYMHFPRADWCDPEYFAQLTAEKAVTSFERGKKRRVYKQLRPRNEALDLTVYDHAALATLGRDILDNLGAWVDAAQGGDLRPEAIDRPRRKRRVRSRGVY